MIQIFRSRHIHDFYDQRDVLIYHVCLEDLHGTALAYILYMFTLWDLYDTALLVTANKGSRLSRSPSVRFEE